MNPPQLEAVQTLRGPLLVLAGAGSGKTRVLTHRIVNLIESGEAFPGEICALTFTNKSAKVMKQRVVSLLERVGIPGDDIWISTFHSMGAKLLRTYGSRIGLESGFTIYDDHDQIVLIKECMEVLGISDKVVSPKAVMHKINALKNEAQDPKEFKAGSHQFFESKIAPIVRLYSQTLEKNNAVDFGDLIFRTYQLFKNDEEFRDMFNERYRFILVDEYQDTNAAQYRLLRLMSEKYRNLCVVGDEDQSIYGWRGADIRNILDFEKDFPDARVIKLEENYRSTGYILRAANTVISNNKQRKEKTLFTSKDDGEPIEVHAHESDLEEARWVVRKIQELVNTGTPLSESAIFYRTNAQSRLLEDRLRAERIPYKIYGGVKFYERAEIKDALAYLRAFVNVRDDIALQRIINVPTRGIGKTTVDHVKEFAQKERYTLFEALCLAVKGESSLGNGPRKKIQVFVDLYTNLQKKLATMSPYEFYVQVLDDTGYLKMLEAENSIEAEARLENLKELGTAISDYETREKLPTVGGFLEEVTLVSEADRVEEGTEFVSLMTIHTAKGTEYNTVFLVGLEEELFPHMKPDVYGETDRDALEEERRLFYVGVTRAMKILHVTHAKSRRVFGVQHMQSPSRFLEELPKDEVKCIDHAPSMMRRSTFARTDEFAFDSNFGSDSGLGGDWGDSSSNDIAQAVGPGDSFKIGVVVQHPDYGQGTVVGREGQAAGLKVTVRFQKVGTKKFVVRFAPLELVTG